MLQLHTTSQHQAHSTPLNGSPVRTAHIDWIHVVGPLDHEPLGEVFYKKFDDYTVIPAGSSALKPKRKRNSNEVYIRSKELQSNGRANMLEFNGCPPMKLQKHNFFGHGDMLDYNYAMFDRQTRKFGLSVDADQRDQWRTGQVALTCTHLTANFWCPPDTQTAIIDAIDQNNRSGKHRDHVTCITLGFTPKERSRYHCATVYAKAAVLAKEWPRPGPFQSRILRASEISLRLEMKLYSQGLKDYDLGYVMRWKDVDINAIFFKVLGQFNISNAIQMLLTADERQMLTNAEQRAYTLWLNGADLSDLFCRTTVWKYITAIRAKTGIDMRGNRRPEKLPLLDMAKMLVQENIVPIPDWAHGGPHYWAPGTAFLER